MVTFLENRKIYGWMKSIARERNVDLADILREATSHYYVQYKDDKPEDSLFAKRTASKATERKLTIKQIESGLLTVEDAQAKNAPIRGPVRIVDVWAALRRRQRAKRNAHV